jgi:hypothetical protein
MKRSRHRKKPIKTYNAFNAVKVKRGPDKNPPFWLNIWQSKDKAYLLLLLLYLFTIIVIWKTDFKFYNAIQISDILSKLTNCERLKIVTFLLENRNT